ncbi:helicase associated domain-containing protein [Cryobacterium zhongshanensis]|uniref:Helicase associated domain-containing protein n=1 Tax=Cryobacterium zhongshanensis TaxID=2928153 RepID=A0AA41UH94_9MICO|nr:helicase associated domain-containing protein [Cryobacterium zhongshanensis]MCI4659675.1 helicase associated domain-containing protein [Cryobacterium zhongshanensis]
MATNDDKWMLYLEHAVAAFRVRGAIPRGESHPGGWVSAQRRAARTGTLWMTPQRQMLLDANLPGWRESPALPQRGRTEITAALQDHLLRTGRLPRQNGGTADEQRLGAWLTAKRLAHHSGELDAELTAWLNANIPGWEGAGPRDTVWERTARELGDHVTKAGSWPNRRSSDADERRVATWLKNRRDDHHNARLGAERIALLDHLAPGWQAPVLSNPPSGL